MPETENIPDNAPSACPGTDSEQAGKMDACAGCPNRTICASSKPKGPDPDIQPIIDRMSEIKHKVLVLSGKGGVGKSTFTSQLVYIIAMDKEKDVGVMDIDICGPSIPKTMGLEGEQVHHSASGWQPVFVDENLGAMSVGFLLPNQDDAVIWRGPKKNGLIKQFLKDVEWGPLDYLVIDTPPGTSDEHLSVVQYLQNCDLAGAVIVTTPQEVSLADVRKEINFCNKLNVKVIGVVENMSTFTCPKCSYSSQIFPATTGGAEKMCIDMNVPFLGKITMDPNIGRCSDEGISFVKDCPDSLAAKQYLEITEKIIQFCDKRSYQIDV